MRRPVLIGLIAVVALGASPALADAAGQSSSPFRDYASPAEDQYGGGGGGPGNGQGNGPPDGRPPNSPPGQSGGGPPGRGAVKGARAQGSATRSSSSTPSSSGAVKGARASSRPVAVRSATAASVRTGPAGGLPFTGHDLTLFVLVATGLLGAGALLGAGERVTRSRRRRAHRAA
ncbi:MAG: hypothetical protein JWO74_1554 [Solirubrobacterales bacterium]|jgi:hypothetical protein|nr:hypothetical protein [Solirubrobacterales bacterium]